MAACAKDLDLRICLFGACQDLDGSNTITFPQLSVAIRSLNPLTTLRESDLQMFWTILTSYARTGKRGEDKKPTAVKFTELDDAGISSSSGLQDQEGTVRVVYGNRAKRQVKRKKWDFVDVALVEGTLSFKATREYAVREMCNPGDIIRTADTAGCSVRLLKKQETEDDRVSFRVKLARPDSEGETLYTICPTSEEEQKMWMSNLVDLYGIYMAVDFTQFLHGMAAVEERCRTLSEDRCQNWTTLLKPDRWQLMPLIVDMPHTEDEEQYAYERMTALERLGLNMIKMRKTPIDLERIGPAITRAANGQLRKLEENQHAKLRSVRIAACIFSGLIGLTFAAMAAAVENVLCYDLNINGLTDAYWVCGIESHAVEIVTNGTVTDIHWELINPAAGMDPDSLLCLSVHVRGSSCPAFLSTVVVVEREDIPAGEGYYAPGVHAASVISDGYTAEASDWMTIEIAGNGTAGTETTRSAVCRACECVVCGCAEHPSSMRDDDISENSILIFWLVLAPVLIVTTLCEMALLVYCVMSYATKIAWALEMRLVPLNPDRLFVADSLVHAAFEMGNPDSALLGVDPAAEDAGDSTKLLALVLYKSKVFLTGLVFKLIINLTSTVEFAFWWKPWLGMVLSVVLWDTFTAWTIM